MFECLDHQWTTGVAGPLDKEGCDKLHARENARQRKPLDRCHRIGPFIEPLGTDGAKEPNRLGGRNACLVFVIRVPPMVVAKRDLAQASRHTHVDAMAYRSVPPPVPGRPPRSTKSTVYDVQVDGETWVATCDASSDTLKMYKVERLVGQFAAQVRRPSPKTQVPRALRDFPDSQRRRDGAPHGARASHMRSA